MGRSLSCRWWSVRWVVTDLVPMLLEVLDIVINGISKEVGDRLRDRHLLDGLLHHDCCLALTGHSSATTHLEVTSNVCLTQPRRRSEIYLRASWRHIHQQGPEHPGFPASQATGCVGRSTFASSPPLKNCSSVFTSSPLFRSEGV